MPKNAGPRTCGPESNDQEPSEDRSKPLSLNEIDALAKQKPFRPQHHFGFPVAVGSTGISLGKGPGTRTYHDDDEDIPDRAVIGAKLK